MYAFCGMEHRVQLTRIIAPFPRANSMETVMAGLLQDVRLALRQLRKKPGFTISAVVMLAVAICANSTMLSWINGTMLHPIPGSRDTDRLVSVMRGQWSTSPTPPFSYLDYRDLRDQNHSFVGSSHTTTTGVR